MTISDAKVFTETTREPANTREAIIQAAVDLFAKRGYHATSMREIAAQVPMRAAGIYYWFENKEAILLYLERAFLDDLFEAVREAVQRQADPAARLAAAIRVHVYFHGLYPQVAFVTDSELRVFTGEDRKEIQDKRDAYQEFFVSILRAGVDQGIFHASDVKVTAYAILLECTGVATWFAPHGNLTLEEVSRIHVELILGSLYVKRPTVERALRATARSSA